jgi:hypothetical protein
MSTALGSCGNEFAAPVAPNIIQLLFMQFYIEGFSVRCTEKHNTSIVVVRLCLDMT